MKPQFLPPGTHDLLAEGVEGASISWIRRQPSGAVRRGWGLCPGDLSWRAGPRRQYLWCCSRFLCRPETPACLNVLPTCLTAHWDTVPSPSPLGGGVSSVFPHPVEAWVPLTPVSQKDFRRRVPPLGLCPPGALVPGKGVHLGMSAWI